MATNTQHLSRRSQARPRHGDRDWARWWTSAADLARAGGGRPAGARWRLAIAGSARRLALLLIAVGVMAAAPVGSWLSVSTATADVLPGESVSKAVVIVRPGDTLWSLAPRMNPDADRSSVIAQVMRLNQMTSDRLLVGQELFVPDGPGS